MTHDLDPLADWFAWDDWPAATCPACRKGTLTAAQPVIHETRGSQVAREHEAWEPEWIAGFFTAELRCARTPCQEVVVATGNVRVRWNGAAPPDGYVEQFRLRFAEPALPMIKVPPGLPEDVASRLAEAGLLIWADPSAAANRLRLTIEQILDHQGVPRSAGTPKGKDVPLKTHNRIEIFGKSNPDVAALLEAVKWIGNQGSHEDVLTQRDVLEGASFLEHALKALYDKSVEEIQRRARAVNEAKGVRGSPSR